MNERTTGTPVGSRTRILVVEDEPEFRDLLSLWLDRNGWEPLAAGDGDAVLDMCTALSPDLVILDLNLPGLDGWGLLGQIRERFQIPVIVVTASRSDAEKVRAFHLGADDYITKPLSFPELMARVETALRRVGGGTYATPARRLIRCGILAVDVERHRVEVSGVEVHVTRTEFRLLESLAEHCGEVVKHRQLLETAWGPGYADETHLLQVAIGNLRSKIAVVTSVPVIETVYGLGYRIPTGE